MKATVFIFLNFLLGIFLAGCSGDDQNTIEPTLTGTWQLVRTFTSSGASGSWKEVRDGYTYTFSATGDFTSSRFEECTYGIYASEANQLILNYGCEEFNTGIESPAGTFVEEFSFRKGFLILSPTYLMCDEGCGFEFKKLRN